MKKKHILIVEDERIVAVDIKMGLKRLGYSICGIAYSGEEAIKKAEETRPDLVLMDIVLEGEMDGIKAAAKIRSRFNIPVVYLTAYADKKTLERAKKTEPFGYIIKPFEDRELDSVIEIALYKHKIGNMLKESEEKYRKLVVDSIDGIAIVQGLKIKFVNKAILKIFGCKKEDDIVGHAFTDFISKSEYRRLKTERILANNKKPNVHARYEFEAIRKDGTKFDAELSASRIIYEGSPAQQGIIRNISERKLAEEELKKKEAFNFALFQHSPIETIVVDREGRVSKTNLARRKSRNKWPNIGNVMYRDYARKHEIDMNAELMKCIKSGKKKEFPELKYDDKFLSISIASFPEGAIITSQDITERKQAEKELRSSQERLRNLTAHLQSIREEERTLVAREMHDELGQSLTALKMDLALLSAKLPKNQRALIDKTKSMSKLVDTTLQAVKRISTELRPGLLDDIGLPAAIEWQGEEFQNRTGIKCKVSIEPEDITSDQDRSTAIFRIFQETLTNVARHASATKVTVNLRKNAAKIELKVRDNGKGITEEQISKPKSFGIIGIRERAHFLGGKVDIKGIRDKGTTVTAKIPLPKEGITR